VANRIDDAIQDAGVISTVGFRERYRPIFQEARRWLADKSIVHVRFQSISGLPNPNRPVMWYLNMEKSGGRALDWGVHATDYVRFMTGLNVVQAQAFYYHPEAYPVALSSSFNYLLSNGASMTLTFVSATPISPDEPWFTFYYEGGYLTIYRYDRLESNGEIVYQADPFDPWFEHDRRFIEAVRSGDHSPLLNDYHDGLYSLAPILAGWESSRRQGETIDIESFMAD